LVIYGYTYHQNHKNDGGVVVNPTPVIIYQPAPVTVVVPEYAAPTSIPTEVVFPTPLPTNTPDGLGSKGGRHMTPNP
jgi:hypothetical protein